MYGLDKAPVKPNSMASQIVLLPAPFRPVITVKVLGRSRSRSSLIPRKPTAFKRAILKSPPQAIPQGCGAESRQPDLRRRGMGNPGVDCVTAASGPRSVRRLPIVEVITAAKLALHPPSTARLLERSFAFP